MTTVRPTYNEVNGEYGPNEIIHSDGGKRLTFDMADYEPQQDEAFAPREQSLDVDPAFLDGATAEQQRQYWTNGQRPNQAELNFLQDQIHQATDPDEQSRLARMLGYKMTGDMSPLMDDDIAYLGLEAPDPNDWSPAQIKQEILGEEIQPNPQAAAAVLRMDLGDSPAAKIVQYLTHQVYDGALGADEAYAKAYNSGVPHHELYAMVNKIRRLGG